MTKKDYELIAKSISGLHKTALLTLNKTPVNAPQYSGNSAYVKAIEQTATEISAALRTNDPKYNSGKFMSQAIWQNY